MSYNSVLSHKFVGMILAQPNLHLEELLEGVDGPCHGETYATNGPISNPLERNFAVTVANALGDGASSAMLSSRLSTDHQSLVRSLGVV